MEFVKVFYSADGAGAATPPEGPGGTETGANGSEGTNGATDGKDGKNEPPEGKNGASDQSKPLDMEQIQKMIQSETDKVRTEYSKKLKQLETEKETLIKDKMSEQEKAEYELQKREREIRERETLLTRNAVELSATNTLATLEMPISFKEFVIGETPEDTEAKAKNLHKLWQKAVDQEVEKRFAQGGRIPPKSKQGQPTGSSMNDLIRGAARR